MKYYIMTSAYGIVNTNGFISYKDKVQEKLFNDIDEAITFIHLMQSTRIDYSDINLFVLDNVDYKKHVAIRNKEIKRNNE